MTVLKSLIGSLAVVFVVFLLTAEEAAAQSTTATPPGEAFTATLTPGNSAVFTVGGVTVTCNRSTTGGAVPPAPGNSNPSGPVSGPVTPPTFTNNTASNCPTNVPFTTATTTTNSINRPWQVQLQYSSAGSTATLIVPKAGAVTTTSGLAACTITIAPSGNITIPGSWFPASGTTPPQISFNTTVPISVTGGIGCPTSATTATFSARYNVNSSTVIVVGP